MHVSDEMPARAATGIAANLAAIRARIERAAHAAGRPADAVGLVAVSKTMPVDAVREAIAAGQRVFGENRVQEAAGKFGPLAQEQERPVLHIIGGLQTNKALDAVRIADAIESLDRPRLADAIDAAMQRVGRSPRLYVQVNVGAEPQKSGVPPEQADGFIEACAKRFGDALEGLMCVPPEGAEPGPHFAWLAACARRHGLAGLSMGMSADFETAIAHGATLVRVGSAIFGRRG